MVICTRAETPEIDAQALAAVLNPEADDGELYLVATGPGIGPHSWSFSRTFVDVLFLLIFPTPDLPPPSSLLLQESGSTVQPCCKACHLEVQPGPRRKVHHVRSKPIPRYQAERLTVYREFTVQPGPGHTRDSGISWDNTAAANCCASTDTPRDTARRCPKCPNVRRSAELRRHGKLSRVRPGTADDRPKSPPRPDQTTPSSPGTVFTNRYNPIPNGSKLV